MEPTNGLGKKIIIKMDYKAKLYLQKCLFINFCVYFVWVFTIAFFFFAKFQNSSYDHLDKYLSITLFLMFTIIECMRLYLGQTGNLLCRIPELAGFLMLSVFMQMPMITYFLFNTYVMNTPIEVTLHAVMWVTILLEIILSCQAINRASAIAKSCYLSRYQGLE